MTTPLATPRPRGSAVAEAITLAVSALCQRRTAPGQDRNTMWEVQGIPAVMSLGESAAGDQRGR